MLINDERDLLIVDQVLHYMFNCCLSMSDGFPNVACQSCSLQEHGTFFETLISLFFEAGIFVSFSMFSLFF